MRDTKNHLKAWIVEKAIQNARAKVNEDLYARLDTKTGIKHSYNCKNWDIGTIKCIKDIGRDNILNEKRVNNADVKITHEIANQYLMKRVQKEEFKRALWRLL